MTNPTPDLLPCPFCGNEASPYGFSKWSRPLNDTSWSDGTPIVEAYFCNCIKCGVSNVVGRVGHQTRADAIAAWNTRTPTPAPNAGAVKVKPLVWHEDEDGNFSAQSVRGGEGVDRCTEPQVIGDNRVTYEAWGIKGEFDTPQEAQAAVEAEIASEILAAIEPTPDPRDAVIARLVGAASLVSDWDEWAFQVGGVCPDRLVNCMGKLRTALAAAEEMMK